MDNDGDGITDSVWVDLGYPARRNAQGQLYKPLFAFMVIGLNGRIPLNTAGNLAGQTGGIPFPLFPRLPRTPTAAARHTRRTWATRSARSIRHTRCRTAMTRTSTPPVPSTIPPRAPFTTVNTQVDNAGIDVRVTQLRNLLAGTRPPQKTTLGTGTDGDTNFVSVETASGSGVPQYATSCPTALPTRYDTRLWNRRLGRPGASSA